MPKISNRTSLHISIGIAVLFFAVCIVGLFILPGLVPMLIALPDNIGPRDTITSFGRGLVMAEAYLVVITFLTADVLLFDLLQRVKKGLVFTLKSVARIRGVSWCCMVLCVLFGCLGYYFTLSWLVSFLALFLGLCLRVTKNVIAEATEIKQDHDLTI